jgi:hypothetical protein
MKPGQSRRFSSNESSVPLPLNDTLPSRQLSPALGVARLHPGKVSNKTVLSKSIHQISTNLYRNISNLIRFNMLYIRLTLVLNL